MNNRCADSDLPEAITYPATRRKGTSRPPKAPSASCEKVQVCSALLLVNESNGAPLGTHPELTLGVSLLLRNARTAVAGGTPRPCCSTGAHSRHGERLRWDGSCGPVSSSPPCVEPAARLRAPQPTRTSVPFLSAPRAGRGTESGGTGTRAAGHPRDFKHPFKQRFPPCGSGRSLGTEGKSATSAGPAGPAESRKMKTQRAAAHRELPEPGNSGTEPGCKPRAGAVRVRTASRCACGTGRDRHIHERPGPERSPAGQRGTAGRPRAGRTGSERRLRVAAVPAPGAPAGPARGGAFTRSPYLSTPRRHGEAQRRGERRSGLGLPGGRGRDRAGGAAARGGRRARRAGG